MYTNISQILMPTRCSLNIINFLVAIIYRLFKKLLYYIKYDIESVKQTFI